MLAPASDGVCEILSSFVAKRDRGAKADCHAKHSVRWLTPQKSSSKPVGSLPNAEHYEVHNVLNTG